MVPITMRSYLSKHETVELLLQRAEALKEQCEAAADPEEKSRLMREWSKVMCEAQAVMNRKSAPDGSETSST